MKQPSLVSTGNFVVPETLTASPEILAKSFRGVIAEEAENEEMHDIVETFHHSSCFAGDVDSMKPPEPEEMA